MCWQGGSHQLDSIFFQRTVCPLPLDFCPLTFKQAPELWSSLLVRLASRSSVEDWCLEGESFSRPSVRTPGQCWYSFSMRWVTCMRRRQRSLGCHAASIYNNLPAAVSSSWHAVLCMHPLAFCNSPCCSTNFMSPQILIRGAKCVDGHVCSDRQTMLCFLASAFWQSRD